MRELITGDFYRLPGAGVNGINNLKVVDRSHLPLVRSGAGFVPGLVWAPLVPDWNGPISVFFLHEDKPILPSMDRRRLVESRKKPRTSDDPVPPPSPAILAVPLDDVGIGEGERSAF